MSKYILKRLFISLLTLLGISVIIFMLVSMSPGSPIDVMCGSSITKEARAILEEQMGLDQPVWIRYINWIKQILHGDLGTSYRTSTAVWKEISSRIGPTLLLTLTALGIALGISVPLGSAAAYKPYSAVDYIASGLSFLGAATPNFFLGLIAIYIFAIKLKVLPNSGMYDSLSDKNLSSLISHLIMPALVLAFQMVGNFLRQMRSSMLECLEDDYVNTARSKGLTEKMVVFKHALKNACIPMLSQISLCFPILIGGAVVTEQIFNWPGLGSLMVISISSRDYPMILGITVVISVFVLTGNIIVDILYGFIDPRIRRSTGKVR